MRFSVGPPVKRLALVVYPGAIRPALLSYRSKSSPQRAANRAIASDNDAAEHDAIE
jgi:hypothetical protein